MEDDTGMSNDTIIRPKCDYKVTRRGHRNSIMIHVERIERMSAELGGDVAWAFRISPSGSTYGQWQIPYFMRDFVGVEGVDREALDAARCARDERRQMEKLLKIAAGAAWGICRKASSDPKRIAEELLSEWAFLAERGDHTFKCEFAAKVAALHGNQEADRWFRRFVDLATKERIPL